MVLKNEQTYFKYLAFKDITLNIISLQDLKYEWPFFNIMQEGGKPVLYQFSHLFQCFPVFCSNFSIIIESSGINGETDRKTVKNS